MEQLFELLSERPTLSIALGFVLAGFLAFVFQDLIRAWIKKKYNLYSESEIRDAMTQASEERVFYSRTSEKLTPAVIDRFFALLTRRRK